MNTSPQTRRPKPIAAWLIIGFNIVAAIALLVIGLLNLPNPESIPIILISLPWVAIPIYFLFRKPPINESRLSSCLSKRFAVLKPGKVGRPDGAGMTAIFAGFIALTIACVSKDKDNTDLFIRIGFFLGAMIAIVFGIIKLRGSKGYRAGLLESEGVLWDLSRNDLASGLFKMKLQNGSSWQGTLETMSFENNGRDPKSATKVPELEDWLCGLW
jgi:hypothetical protein